MMSSIDKFYVKSQLQRALSLNGQMHSQLLLMQEKLERLLNNVKNSYEANEALLRKGGRKRIKGFGIKGAYLKGGTFYFKGNMFFKDIKCRNCPNNEDYESRKKENELFPMDLNLKARHVWSMTDKQRIILGIKEQIIHNLTQSSKKRDEASKKIYSDNLAKLLKLIPDNFHIDWDYISSCILNHRHSATNCEAIWNLFLHPSLNRSSWTENENHTLLVVARKFNFQNWQEIAKECGQRSDFQCFVQYKNHVCHMLPESSSKWTKDDDKRLVEAVAKNTVNGNINWNNVQSYFPNKPKTTIHSRYNCSINPNIDRGVLFSPEEDVLLIAAIKKYGKFTSIPRSLFPNRSAIQLRSHYKNTLCKRHNHQPWTLEDDIKLMEYVNENGTKSWMECEKIFESRHARHSCRTRYLTIKRHLAKDPDCSIETLPRKKICTSTTKSTVNIHNWKEKVDELSLSNTTEQQNTRNSKKPKPDKVFKSRRRKTDNAVKPKKLKKIKSDTTEKINNLKKAKTVKQKKIKREKPYFIQLRAFERNCYDFFKYAYNFAINQHPCQNIKINNVEFSNVRSALNPLYPTKPLCDFKSDIAKYMKQDIIRNPKIIPNFKAINCLPPSWSTAMGFRALCINTTDISTNLPSDYSASNRNNDYIKKFRKRLRFIFYSTVLLSRLNPSMVGIVSGLKPLESWQLKGKMNISQKEKSSINKKKSANFNETVKTEIEI